MPNPFQAEVKFTSETFSLRSNSFPWEKESCSAQQ